MWSLPRREERQLEPADLHLVARGELRLVDLFAVHVRPVEAADVSNEPRAAAASLEDRMLAGHRDVVEEDVTIRAPADRRGVLIQQERRARVRATLDQKESLAGLELVVRERELLVSLLFPLDHRERDGHVVVK